MKYLNRYQRLAAEFGQTNIFWSKILEYDKDEEFVREVFIAEYNGVDPLFPSDTVREQNVLDCIEKYGWATTAVALAAKAFAKHEKEIA